VPTQARLSEVAEAWDRTKDTTNVALLEPFIVRYKDTFFAQLARARIDELKKHEPPPIINSPGQVAIATPPALPTKNDGEAARFYKLSADAFGQNNLGNCYRDGRGGLTKDDREAARLYRLSADQGSSEGRSTSASSTSSRRSDEGRS